MNIRLIFFFFSLPFSLLAQKTVGLVIDLESGEPMAFVNIIYDDDPTQGVVSDIDGRFVIEEDFSIGTLTFSFIGYETKTLPFRKGKMVVKLQPESYEIAEVVVRPGENPANRIIREVIKNRKKNNPKNAPKFQYTSYNKVVYDFVPDSLAQKELLANYEQAFGGGAMFLMESVTERRYIYPEISEEKVLATRVSGFKHPVFATFATDIQPFAFYEDIITVYDVKYLNPISPGSLRRYEYKIEDTLFQNIDTTFILSFRPRKGKHFEGLKGLLYINTNHFAIQNVIAEPANPGLVDVKIQQEYEFVDGVRWFPKKLSFELFIEPGNTGTGLLKVTGKSYFRDIDLSPDFKKKDLSVSTFLMDELANKRDDDFWNNYRIDSLSSREHLTYQVVDSIGQKLKFDALMNLTAKLSVNKVGVGVFDLELSESLVGNKYEGTRLGIGLRTNEKFLKKISLGGFAGYGLRDQTWKYGGDVLWTLSKRNEIELKVKIQNNLRETGRSSLRAFERERYDFRSLLSSRMDKIEQQQISFAFRALRFAKFKFSLSNSRVVPKYNYSYTSDNQESITKYNQVEFAFNFRYAFAEKFYETATDRISLGTKYPVFFLSYSKGLDKLPFDLAQGDVSYNKLEMALEETIDIRRFGQLHYRLEGGLIDQSVPYGLLFSGEGSYDGQVSFFVRDYFQTARPQEFLSDRYANIFIAHHLGSLFSIKKFSPLFILHQNMGWGTLADASVHGQVRFSEKKNGFFESGLQLDNLVKINVLNMAYLGLGVGAFYRYGDYAYAKAIDNFAFKLSVTYATR